MGFEAIIFGSLDHLMVRTFVLDLFEGHWPMIGYRT